MAKPRTWYAADANFLADPKVEELGLEYGPEGPLVVVALHGLAKQLEGQLEAGQVGGTWPILARRVFVTTSRVKAIVTRAIVLGLLDNVLISGDKFLVRFPHWSEWQRTPDAGNAERCRRYRGREAEREEEETGTEAAQERADIAEVFSVWTVECGHPSAKLTPARRKAIRARLREGYDVARLVRAIQGCTASDFHMGRDPQTQGKRYDDLTLICRNGEKVEQFEYYPLAPEPMDPEDDEGTEEMYK